MSYIFVLIFFLISSMPVYAQYCTSNGDATDGFETGTRRVRFNTIDNSTPREDNDYSDFTAITTNVTQNTAYNLTINVNTDGAFTTHTFAWIDWNQDLDFDDPGESFDLGTRFNASNGGTSLSPLSITIPLTATVGNTRMRISTKYNSDPTNCETGFDGEVEDYTLNIVAAASNPEINITGLGTTINDGDNTPSTTDDTDFGFVSIGGTNANTFTIQNIGTATLNLTGASPFVTISGAGTAYFSVTTIPSNTIAASGSTTFVITFAPLISGAQTATISIANDDSDENPYTFTIRGNDYCTSNGNAVDGFNTGTRRVRFNTIDNSTANEDNDYSDFTAISTNVTQGIAYNLTVNVNTDGAFTTHTFAWIDWNQDLDFDDPGESFDLGTRFNASNGGTSLSPLSITIPVSATLGNTRMRISTKYNADPTSCETGFDGEVEDYTLNIVSGVPAPEMDITGMGNSILNGDTTPTTTDGTNFGSLNIGNTLENSFDIDNLGTATLTLTGASPFLTISGTGAAYFSITRIPSNSITSGSSTNFRITFAPLVVGAQTATVTIANNDSDENPYTFDIIGNGTVPLTVGPGGITNNLQSWLKSTSGLGLNDGDSVSTWFDQGRGADAVTLFAGQEPTYQDNATDNVNFNSVVDFVNTYNSFTLDDDYSYDDTNTQFMEAASGFYTNDIFVVVLADTPVTSTFGSMDIFCADSDTGTNEADATGVGLGSYTQRFTGEVITYATGTSSGVGAGYGIAEVTNTTSYPTVGIINARNRSDGADGSELFYNARDIGTGTYGSEIDIPAFINASDAKFWLGRSEGWEATFDGKMCEIISFSARNTDASLTDNRNRIMSYLAIKYGITLGVNGTSQDYVDTAGNVIWDQSANVGFNYDIAGIGRSDDAGLTQEQSKSVNANTMVTMGLTTIEATNNANLNTFANDENYLVWGNDNGSLAAAPDVTVDMSSGITGLTSNVTFTAITRKWKVVETGGDIATVTVSVPEASLSATISPPGSYLMFISNTSTFSPTSEYRIMTLNGTDLEATYDFNGTKYITFGYAPEYVYTRSVDFDGSVDYMDSDDVLDLTGDFSISAWVKRGSGSSNTDIVSKRNAPYTEGYALRIGGADRAIMLWKDSGGTTQQIISSTTIPQDEWHQIAVTYNDVTNQAILYIDGVPETVASLNAPVVNTEHFLIGAANYLSTSAHFDGTIDEVRVWNTTLTVNQVRYIMNQELIEHTDNSVNGTIIPQSITKNEVSTIPWANLSAYYPMTTYTFTNIKDESGNGNTSAIRNLNTVDFQTAPLPYESTSNGVWTNSATWLNSSVQVLPGTVDWNIVRTNHNIDVSTNTTVLGLMVETNQLDVDNDNKLEVSHYLELDGTIDLVDESQLVQTSGSDLDLTSAGSIEKDQGGTADLYTYNYWTTPVSPINITQINTDFTVNSMLNDGSDPNNPLAINWTTGSYDGSPGTPITLSSLWIYKFDDRLSGDYTEWQYIGHNGNLSVAQGYTMKGPGTGGVAAVQNYTFIGKPNNDQTSDEIQISINGGNSYLVGNPFPSALDADDFIGDNPHLDGTLYFWEHWGGGSHVLTEYQGGYGMYNLSGGVMAVSHPDVSAAGAATKTPGRYIPVGQGFFVNADSNGTIEFNNSQRNFVKFGSSSVFMFYDPSDYDEASSEGGSRVVEYEEVDDTFYDAPDTRTKFRIGFDSPNELHRQLLLTIDSRTSLNVDYGYDGIIAETQIDDMSWIIENDNYIIQGIPSLEPGSNIILPLYVITQDSGKMKISIDELEFVDSSLTKVYLHDKVLGTYTNLIDTPYRNYLEAGEYTFRFEIVLKKYKDEKSALDENRIVSNEIIAMHKKVSKEITVLSKIEEETLQNVQLYNLIGQLVKSITFDGNNAVETFSSIGLAKGTYIVRTTTNEGVYSNKIIIE